MACWIVDDRVRSKREGCEIDLGQQLSQLLRGFIIEGGSEQVSTCTDLDDVRAVHACDGSFKLQLLSDLSRTGVHAPGANAHRYTATLQQRNCFRIRPMNSPGRIKKRSV